MPILVLKISHFPTTTLFMGFFVLCDVTNQTEWSLGKIHRRQPIGKSKEKWKNNKGRKSKEHSTLGPVHTGPRVPSRAYASKSQLVSLEKPLKYG